MSLEWSILTEEEAVILSGENWIFLDEFIQSSRSFIYIAIVPVATSDFETAESAAAAAPGASCAARAVMHMSLSSGNWAQSSMAGHGNP